MTPAYKPYAYSLDTLNLKKQNISLPHQKEEYFYKYKDGTLFPYYKKDIKNIIDVLKPSTFLPIMKELDIPFYEEEWLRVLTHEISYQGNTQNVFGKYLAWCKLVPIRKLGFEDSNTFFMNKYDYDNYRYVIVGINPKLC